MQNWKLLIASHLAAGLFGLAIAPREIIESEVKSVGVFSFDTKRVLAAAVHSLRSENRLLVFSYKGAAIVSVQHNRFLVLTGWQQLIIPAEVGYFVELSQLELSDTHYDEQSKTLTVRLPALVLGNVAFQPEAATTQNGGLLTFSQAQVDELSKANYQSARRAFIKQAQGATLVAAARKEAERAVGRTFQIALGAAGVSGVKVVIKFV